MDGSGGHHGDGRHPDCPYAHAHALLRLQEAQTIKDAPQEEDLNRLH